MSDWETCTEGAMGHMHALYCRDPVPLRLQLIVNMTTRADASHFDN